MPDTQDNPHKEQRKIPAFCQVKLAENSLYTPRINLICTFATTINHLPAT